MLGTSWPVLASVLLAACGGGGDHAVSGTPATSDPPAGTLSALNPLALAKITGRYLNESQDVTINASGAIAGLVGDGCRVSGAVTAADATGLFTMRATFTGGACWFLHFNDTLEGPSTYTFVASAQVPVASDAELVALPQSDSARVTALRLKGRKPLAASDTFNFEIHYVPRNGLASPYLTVIATNQSGSLYPSGLMTGEVDITIDTVGSQSFQWPTYSGKYDPRVGYTFVFAPGFVSLPGLPCLQAQVRVTDTQGIGVTRSFPLCIGEPLDLTVNAVVQAPSS